MDTPGSTEAVVLCGALAYDHIGTLATGDLTTLQAGSGAAPARLNLKLARIATHFGGCAINIAYGLAQQRLPGIPLCFAGIDVAPTYVEHLHAHRIPTTGLVEHSGRCSSAYIFTEPGTDRQLTAFYCGLATPGADQMTRLTQRLRTLCAQHRPAAAALLPDQEQLLLTQAPELAACAVRLWNPGQFTEHLSAAGAQQLWRWCNLVVVNQHEWQTLLPLLSGLQLVQPRLTIVSAGAGPVELRRGQESHWVSVPVVDVPMMPTDPTGCGDALIAGVLGRLVQEHTALPLDLSAMPLRSELLRSAIARGCQLAKQCLQVSGAQGY